MRRAVVIVADTRCGDIKINQHSVTKCSLCKCTGHETSAAGLPSSAAYFLEKLAMCRLRRCVRPCEGRPSLFPRLLRWDDARHELVTSNEGSPLATDIKGDKRRFTLAKVIDDARRRGLPPPLQQVHCMQRQLDEAGVAHLDVGCKNVLVKAKKRLFLYRRKISQLEAIIARLRKELTDFKGTVRNLKAYILRT